MVFVGRQQCADQDSNVQLRFHSGEALSLVYIAEDDLLVVTKPDCDVACVIDMQQPALSILSLDVDIDDAVGAARIQEKMLVKKRSHSNGALRGGRGGSLHVHFSRSEKSIGFRTIKSILPAVWLSTEFTGNAFLSCPAA
eukprot:scpid37059/ scgid12856/ 